ncbi:MAG: hypothetical protein MUF42_17755 [Cytophagaceae bacterium]|jgi:hypothetical protein|nr:hypothetical protein [Cytophagaceae bacterium]
MNVFSSILVFSAVFFTACVNFQAPVACYTGEVSSSETAIISVYDDKTLLSLNVNITEVDGKKIDNSPWIRVLPGSHSIKFSVMYYNMYERRRYDATFHIPVDSVQSKHVYVVRITFEKSGSTFEKSKFFARIQDMGENSDYVIQSPDRFLYKPTF